MKTSGWWYKDRLGRSRGPMELIQLKTAWGAGIIDKDTFIWGEDMDEWAPICMVYGLERAVATWEGSVLILCNLLEQFINEMVDCFLGLKSCLSTESLGIYDEAMPLVKSIKGF